MIISESDLYEIYINKNKTAKEIAESYETSIATVNRLLKQYGIKKSKEQRLANVSKTKQAKTAEEKAIYSQRISEARKGKGLGKDPWNKGTHGLQTAWNKGLHTTGKPRTAESLEKARQTCLEKYGVDWACQRQEARLKGQNSAANIEFEQLLIENNIEYSREFPIKSYSYDFKIDKYLIEIDPYATHNSTWGIRDNPPKTADYHKNKSKLATENGYYCIHIFDWDNRLKILNRFKQFTDVCEFNVKEISRSEAKDFLDNYHPQNYTSAKKHYGIVYKNELVEVMTFGKPRYNKNFDWELLRVCAKPGYHIIDGCKKMLEAFKNTEHPDNLIVYCDLSKLDGKIYENLGFTKLKYAPPARHWYNPKTNTHITDAFLWRKGFDRLFGTNYGKQASNTKLMLEHGFVEIYDCGQATYVWYNTKSE